jgi:hypothetical protein
MAQEQQQQQLPAQVLFAGSFSSSGKDEVVFSRPVVVTDVQVVASNMLAHELLLPDFRGLTQASPFQIEVSAHTARVIGLDKPYRLTCNLHLRAGVLQGRSAFGQALL